MFEFLNPHLLYLIIPIFLLVIFMYLKKKNTKNFIAFWDLKSIYKFSSNYLKLYYFIILLIFINAVFIISQPIERNVDEKIKKNGIDIMLVLDVSPSMDATDMLPNRLEVAKNTLIDFLDTRKNDRVWLVLFSLRPFTSLPLNFDYNISKKIINRVNVDIINNQNLIWTWIGEWLILAADNLKDSDRTKVIILITDWSPSWNNIINPIIATKFINEKYKDNKIKIYTIWIWWDKDIFLERSWGYIKGVDSELLTNISNLTNWKYYNARDKIELNSIFKEISNLEKTDIEIDTKETIKSQSKYFTYVLSFLLLLLLLIKARKYIYNR